MQWAVGFVPNSLDAAACSACIHVPGDVVEDVGPVILPSEHLSGFGSTQMSRKVAVVA